MVDILTLIPKHKKALICDRNQGLNLLFLTIFFLFHSH